MPHRKHAGPKPEEPTSLNLEGLFLPVDDVMVRAAEKQRTNDREDVVHGIKEIVKEHGLTALFSAVHLAGLIDEGRADPVSAYYRAQLALDELHHVGELNRGPDLKLDDSIIMPTYTTLGYNPEDFTQL